MTFCWGYYRFLYRVFSFFVFQKLLLVPKTMTWSLLGGTPGSSLGRAWKMAAVDSVGDFPEWFSGVYLGFVFWVIV